MLDEKIYVTRIRRFCDELEKNRYFGNIPLEAEFIYDQEYPIPYNENLEDTGKREYSTDEKTYQFTEIKPGDEWGKTWGSGWFRFTGKIPADWKGKEVIGLIDVEAEGCVFKDGKPYQGLTNKIHWNVSSSKKMIILTKKASQKDSDVFLLVETGANGLFGAGQEFYRLQQADLCLINRDFWDLYFDLEVIYSLIEKLPERSPRRQKLIRKTNDAISCFRDGSGVEEALSITKELLSMPAAASALTGYGIGHAHLDLGWLWPVRETRRKAGRTFSTALRFMEEYPEYRFGSSQAQLYEWVKEDYPKLYEEIKKAIADGKWECQGAMWVEPDMNITGGESLVRQCFYGKKFWKEEFGIDIDNLWLPDVFGYSAALPQILKKSGVDYFMTQKISWNETNTFPHHTFLWEGIDGTEILTHFLPTNDYNCSNLPKQMIEAEERFAQSDVANEFLNLYGIGDGGGGPSRIHIELAKRQQNTEGAPKFKFSFAEEFFRKLDEIPKDDLPKWQGELYLELHRGTYTTQALMKRLNRMLEIKLRDVEFLSTITGSYDKEIMSRIWKNTLLNQFHDILPGSSIKWVYDDALALSEQNLVLLGDLEKKALNNLNPEADENEAIVHYQIFNTQSWERKDVVIIELPDNDDDWQAFNSKGESIYAEIFDGLMEIQVTVPPMGYTSVELRKTGVKVENNYRIKVTPELLENEVLRIEFNSDGVIERIYDKELQKEMLDGYANQFLLYEDKPNDWGAWDINHFYRETVPETAELVSINVAEKSALSASLDLEFKIGNSTISQVVVLDAGERMIRFWNHVQWHEKNKMLRLRAVPAIKNNEAAFEIQYGVLKRATHSNTSWERSKFEVCGHRFADLSSENYGFALINDGKYGHYVKDNVMELTLLRSPQYPDDTADQGYQPFSFAFLPHINDLEHSDVLRQAHNFNNEMITHCVSKLPEVKEKSFFKVCGDNVKIEVVKPADNGNGIILRLYEYYGIESSVKVKTAEKWKEWRETDLMENDMHLLLRSAKEGEFDFKPFEIRTFRLI